VSGEKLEGMAETARDDAEPFRLRVKAHVQAPASSGIDIATLLSVPFDLAAAALYTGC
jgi:hypothetical protein